MITSIVFYIFASILIFAAFKVISTNNAVAAVLYLILTFITSSVLWLLLNIEFLALALIVIYVGAVMVLFLFVVMMLDVDVDALKQEFRKHLPLSIFLGILVLSEIIMVISNNSTNLELQINQNANTINNYSSISNLSWILYTKYSLGIEIASIILLVGLVVAVALTMRKSKKEGKYQNINAQTKINAKDRITLIDLKEEDKIFYKGHEK